MRWQVVKTLTIILNNPLYISEKEVKRRDHLENMAIYGWKILKLVIKG